MKDEDKIRLIDQLLLIISKRKGNINALVSDEKMLGEFCRTIGTWLKTQQPPEGYDGHF